MEKETRNRISSSLKFGLEFSTALVDQLVDLVDISYSRKNQEKPYSLQVLKKIFAAFSKDQQMAAFVVKDKKALLAGGAIVFDANRAYYIIGGVNQNLNYSGVGSLAIWQLITYAKETLNLREFDFEGSMNPQIELFFRGFGGKLVPYYSIYKPNLMHNLVSLII
jgi:lipid II:glycine glycyltransferase (peptidoglycan interpeptide bridge formation enzyme)